MVEETKVSLMYDEVFLSYYWKNCNIYNHEQNTLFFPCTTSLEQNTFCHDYNTSKQNYALDCIVALTRSSRNLSILISLASDVDALDEVWKV